MTMLSVVAAALLLSCGVVKAQSSDGFLDQSQTGRVTTYRVR